MKKERFAWIDYTKFFASVMILSGHFHDAAVDSCAVVPAVSGLYNAINTFLMPFQNGKFWVMVFCMVSGFLGSKKIRSFAELTAESIVRYLRFALPLLLCNALAFGLWKSGLIYSRQYAELFRNSWLASHYAMNYRVFDVIRQTVFMGAALDSTLWMLRPLFIGNILILCTNYATHRFSRRSRLIAEIGIFAALLVLSARWLTALYIAATFLGLLLCDTRREHFGTPVTIFLVVAALAVRYTAAFGMDWSDYPQADFLRGVVYTAAFVYGRSRLPECKKVNLSALSFWVFLLHIPVICSLSAWILLRCLSHFWVGFLLAQLAAVACVTAMGLILMRTFDVWTGRWLKNFKGWLLALLQKK